MLLDGIRRGSVLRRIEGGVPRLILRGCGGLLSLVLAAAVLGERLAGQQAAAVPLDGRLDERCGLEGACRTGRRGGSVAGRAASSPSAGAPPYFDSDSPGSTNGAGEVAAARSKRCVGSADPVGRNLSAWAPVRMNLRRNLQFGFRNPFDGDSGSIAGLGLGLGRARSGPATATAAASAPALGAGFAGFLLSGAGLI